MQTYSLTLLLLFLVVSRSFCCDLGLVLENEDDDFTGVVTVTYQGNILTFDESDEYNLNGVSGPLVISLSGSSSGDIVFLELSDLGTPVFFHESDGTNQVIYSADIPAECDACVDILTLPCDADGDGANDQFHSNCLCLAPVLPVVWGGIEAYEERDYTLIKWGVTSQENNAYYHVERSEDGRKWEHLGTVIQGIYNAYEYRDKVPASSCYYRVKQVDFSGDSSYSPMASLDRSRYVLSERYSNLIGNAISRDMLLPGGVYILTYTYSDGTQRSTKIIQR